MYSKAAPVIAIALLLSVAGPSAYSRELGLKTVVVDPGHGGKDPGSVSPDRKTYEKTLVLEICREFARKVGEQYPDVKVILTRDKDVFVPLGDRAAIATRAEANLFISVHVDAVPQRASANGFSAFILGPSQKYDTYDFNMEVCKRENSVIYLEEDYSTRYGDFDSSSPESQIMLQLMANAYREQSLSFAETVSERMGKCGSFQKSMGVRQDNFQVLRQASMPAVLLEFGFITNSSDLSSLRSQERRSAMVDALVASFGQYKKAYDASVMLPSGSQSPDAAEKTPAVPLEAKDAPAGPEKVMEVSEATSVPAQAEEAPAAASVPAPSEEAPAASGAGERAKAASAAPQANSAPAPAASGDDREVGAAYYGTQVLASSRLLFKTDPYFKGNEVRIEKFGDIYRYIVGIGATREEAAKKYEELKAIFPDSFRVEVGKNGVSRF